MPSDFDIFSPSTSRKRAWIQKRANIFPVSDSDCAISFSTITEAAQEYMAHSSVHIIAQPEYEGTDFTPFPCQPDHADKYETSLMMAVRPELVQMDKLAPEVEIPYVYPYRENAWGYHSPQGPWKWSEDLATTASPELGERVMAALLDHLAGLIEEAIGK